MTGFIHFHRWSDWRVIEKGPIVVHDKEKIREIGTYLTQQRECEVCKKQQLNTQRVTL